jgi:hypothetical protein
VQFLTVASHGPGIRSFHVLTTCEHRDFPDLCEKCLPACNVPTHMSTFVGSDFNERKIISAIHFVEIPNLVPHQ